MQLRQGKDENKSGNGEEEILSRDYGVEIHKNDGNE